MNQSIEELVINAFLLKRRRERALFELSNEKKRNSFLFDMRACKIFQPNCIERIVEPISSPEIVYDILKKRGASESCYVMRSNSPYDGQTVALEQGLADLIFNGPGLLSCIHGKLAYLEEEVPGAPGPPKRFLLLQK